MVNCTLTVFVFADLLNDLSVALVPREFEYVNRVTNEEMKTKYAVLGMGLFYENHILFCDGVNEKGVFCELNLLYQGDNGITTGTNPGKSNLCMTTIVRYILDYAKSANHAIELLQKKNIFAPTGAVAGEYHFLIADNENTFEVEFIDNEMIVINNFLNNKPIVTSFYLNGYDGSKESLNLHAQGVERFNILSNTSRSTRSKNILCNI